MRNEIDRVFKSGKDDYSGEDDVTDQGRQGSQVNALVATTPVSDSLQGSLRIDPLLEESRQTIPGVPEKKEERHFQLQVVQDPAAGFRYNYPSDERSIEYFSENHRRDGQSEEKQNNLKDVQTEGSRTEFEKWFPLARTHRDDPAASRKVDNCTPQLGGFPFLGQHVVSEYRKTRLNSCYTYCSLEQKKRHYKCLLNIFLQK